MPPKKRLQAATKTAKKADILGFEAEKGGVRQQITKPGTLRTSHPNLAHPNLALSNLALLFCTRPELTPPGSSQWFPRFCSTTNSLLQTTAARSRRTEPRLALDQLIRTRRWLCQTARRLSFRPSHLVGYYKNFAQIHLLSCWATPCDRHAMSDPKRASVTSRRVSVTLSLHYLRLQTGGKTFLAKFW